MQKDIQKNLRLYYIYTFLMGTWFASGIWLFFSRRFLTDANLGLVDAIALGIGLLVEIPSGVIADKIGRRRTVIIGTLLYALGYGLLGLSVNGWMIFCGVVLTGLGGALQSGADEAMMYDYLKSHGEEKQWARVSVNRSILARFTYVLALVIGGFAYTYYDRLPFLMRSFTLFLMIIPLIRLAVIDRFQHSEGESGADSKYISLLGQGIKELFKKDVLWLIPLYLLVQGCSYMIFTGGILRPLLYEKSGLAIEFHSYAISIALALTVLAMFAVRKWGDALSTKRSLFVISCMCLLGFVVNIGNQSLVLSLFGLTLLQVASYSLMPLLSTALNHRVSSRNRATTISAANFLQGLLYIGVAPLIGWLSYNGQINLAAVGVTGLVLVGILASLLLSRLDRLETK